MADWISSKLFESPVDTEAQKLSALERLLAAPTLDVLKFASGIIQDTSESMLVRAETCRFLQDVDWDDWGSTGLCESLVKVLPDVDDDVTVRQWAAYIVGKCHDHPEVIQVSYSLLLDDYDLPWNMMLSFRECEILSPGLRAMLEELLSIEYLEERLKNAIRSLLSNSK